MPSQMYNIGKIKVQDIYFPFWERQNDAKLLLAPSREGLVILSPGVAWLATLREPLGLPLAHQEVLQAWEPACSPIEKWVARPSCQGSRFAV